MICDFIYDFMEFYYFFENISLLEYKMIFLCIVGYYFRFLLIGVGLFFILIGL